MHSKVSHQSSPPHSINCSNPAWEDIVTQWRVLVIVLAAADDRNSIDIFSRRATLNSGHTTTSYGHCARETSSAKPFIILRYPTLPLCNTLSTRLYIGHRAHCTPIAPSSTRWSSLCATGVKMHSVPSKSGQDQCCENRPSGRSGCERRGGSLLMAHWHSHQLFAQFLPTNTLASCPPSSLAHMYLWVD